MSRLATEAGIVLLFTDANMPGDMDGIALAHYTASRHPSVGLIITSGGSWIGDDRLPSRCQFLAKPYSDRDLLKLAHARFCGTGRSRIDIRLERRLTGRLALERERSINLRRAQRHG